ncbi:MAG TPA: antibiotic biosynthesis monooxygenase [Streptosporangiaceae bacterium]|jgi:quinol monooxygenase YgiN|nr:antibiotic biosynthesis monooxygenase [Streptosporangiaceae bacterium]
MSSSFSLIIAGAGAVTAAVGSGIVLARLFRAPRADLVSWSIALVGLLISLGAQTLGYLVGFDSKMFRAMELGAQVIAPMALILALSEVAGRGLGARFCARVYIPALAFITGFVLILDQLADVAFKKTWPDPAVYYQLPPNYALEFAIGPVTALIAVIAVGIVMARSRAPGWNAVLPAQMAAGVAALLLAYPGLVGLVKFVTKQGLPISHEFTLCCAAAAGLTLYAAIKVGRIDLRVLHETGAAAKDQGPRAARPPAAGRGAVGRSAAGPASASRRDDFERDEDYGRNEAYSRSQVYGRKDTHDRNDDYGPREDFGRRGDPDRWDEAGARGGYDLEPAMDQTGDFDRFVEDTGQGPYADGGLYRPDDDWSRAGGPDDFDAAPHTMAGRDSYDGDYATGDFATGQFDASLASADLAADLHPADVRPDPGERGRSRADQRGRHDQLDAGADPADPEPARADLFGQIAIYTLLEDRIAEFDQLTEKVVQDVRSREPDTLVYIVHAVPSAPMQRILYEVYRDRDAYEWHRQQPYVQQFDADRRPYVLATNVIELGLQGAKVSPFPSVTELFGEPGYDTSGFERPDYLRDYGRPEGGGGW